MLDLKTLSTNQDRAFPKMLELLEAVKPSGFFLYEGNVKSHFKTELPLRFIPMIEVKQALKGWKIFSIAKEVRLLLKNPQSNDSSNYFFL